jgi:hypothetical protein
MVTRLVQDTRESAKNRGKVLFFEVLGKLGGA